MTASSQRVQQRSIVLVSPDAELRARIAARLEMLHWTVHHASGGAEALALTNDGPPEVMVVDHWLPDLQPAEFLEYVAALWPATELIHMDSSACKESGARSVRHNEIVHVLRAAADQTAEALVDREVVLPEPVAAEDPATSHDGLQLLQQHDPAVEPSFTDRNTTSGKPLYQGSKSQATAQLPVAVTLLPDVVGNTPPMQELSRMVRLVAPHTATVLVLGETGTGKELVAKAVHRLSARAAKPFLVLNCAAIPEQLLEAELFGHTRGAFTGAVASRMGRIEAANGGTLFLDEIGEMPLPLQAKMLRFLENGEVQRVGDNETSRVDVRIVAATHQPLLQHAEQRRFRLDLYHRLAVFPVDIPSLRERAEDIPMLVGYLLGQHKATGGQKALRQDALDCLMGYNWQGNVRELGHVVHRAVILAGDAPVITPEHLRMRGSQRIE